MQEKYIEIGERRVGRGHPCFIIAEAGVNHNGQLGLARKLVDIAVDANCDSVKFQSFKTELFATPDTPKAKYSLAGTDQTESHTDMLQTLELNSSEHQTLFNYCGSRGIVFLSSPFEETSADMLEMIGVSGFKIASGELTNLPLLEHVATFGKPMIVSTGMADLMEVDQAIRSITEHGNEQIVLLHCTTAYPTIPEDVNLRAMETLATAFGFPVGYSDHTRGNDVALAAVAMGACVIEKHVTLDRSLPGPDQQASIEANELDVLVKAIRTMETSLGDGLKKPRPSEIETAITARKSLVAARDIPQGTAISRDMLVLKRPGSGLPASMLPIVVGRSVRCDVPVNTLISLDVLG